MVQALPSTAALADLRGALRYHGATASHLGEILRLRTVSRYGVDVRVGIGPTGSRQVRGFLKAQGRELDGHLKAETAIVQPVGSAALVGPALGRGQVRLRRGFGRVPSEPSCLVPEDERRHGAVP